MNGAPNANVVPFERHKLLVRGMTLLCPHCKTPAFIRSSRMVTDTYREAWGGCVLCGFKGTAHTSWDYQVLPSLMPNPSIQLPQLNYAEAVERFTADEIAKRDQLDLFVSSG